MARKVTVLISKVAVLVASWIDATDTIDLLPGPLKNTWTMHSVSQFADQRDLRRRFNSIITRPIPKSVALVGSGRDWKKRLSCT